MLFVISACANSFLSPQGKITFAMLAVISLLPSYNSRFADGINLATLRTKNHRPRKPCLWCWDKSNNQSPEFNRLWCKFLARISREAAKEVSRKERKGAKIAAIAARSERCGQQLHTKHL
jgi:hypothetical protein